MLFLRAFCTSKDFNTFNVKIKKDFGRSFTTL
jgi:hypothetical protein